MVSLTQLNVENFGVFQGPFSWNLSAGLNAVIGENDTGKSHLLKLLYAISRAVEEYSRLIKGPEPREFSEVLAQKLRWCFLPPKLELGKLVSKGGNARTSISLLWNTGKLSFAFGKDTTSKIIEHSSQNLEDLFEKPTIFLPPKEVLSLYDAIIATREGQVIAAFDDTYYDLVKDFRQPTIQGNYPKVLKTAFEHLREVTGDGEVEISPEGIWFQRGKDRFGMAQTAEGIKKIGILPRLIRNRRLVAGGVLCVDEPEVNLHPKAVCRFADMLHQMAKSGIQIFLTSHSYFLIKRLEQCARLDQSDHLILDLRPAEAGGIKGISTRLADGMPDNPIIQQSIDLFDEDVRLEIAT